MFHHVLFVIIVLCSVVAQPYFTLLQPILFCPTLLRSTLPTLSNSMLFHSLPLCPIALHPIVVCSARFSPTLFYPILLHLGPIHTITGHPRPDAGCSQVRSQHAQAERLAVPAGRAEGLAIVCCTVPRTQTSFPLNSHPQAFTLSSTRSLIQLLLQSPPSEMPLSNSTPLCQTLFLKPSLSVSVCRYGIMEKCAVCINLDSVPLSVSHQMRSPSLTLFLPLPPCFFP